MAQQALARLGEQVTAWRRALKRDYDRSINRDLSRQNWPDLLLRNVTAQLQLGYQLTLQQLPAIERGEERGGEWEKERDGLLAALLEPYAGSDEELLQHAVQHHRSSCALSNFPDEHRPSPEYIARVIAAIEQQWQAFQQQIRERLST